MRQPKKPTIKEFRESLQEHPVLQFDFIRARELLTRALQEFLYPLNHSFDYLDLCPELNSELCLPTKQLRQWMQCVTAETIHLRIDTDTHILHVCYIEDGIKGRAEFKLQSPERDPKGLIVKVELPIRVTPDSVFSMKVSETYETQSPNP